MSDLAWLLGMFFVGALNWYFGYQNGKDAGLEERDKLWDEVHGINRFKEKQ